MFDRNKDRATASA